jgi:hypothetical protein
MYTRVITIPNHPQRSFQFSSFCGFARKNARKAAKVHKNMVPPTNTILSSGSARSAAVRQIWLVPYKTIIYSRKKCSGDTHGVRISGRCISTPAGVALSAQIWSLCYMKICFPGVTTPSPANLPPPAGAPSCALRALIRRRGGGMPPAGIAVSPLR